MANEVEDRRKLAAIIPGVAIGDSVSITRLWAV
jgi:hypothetical protein